MRFLLKPKGYGGAAAAEAALGITLGIVRILFILLTLYITTMATEEAFGQVTVRVTDDYSAVHYSGNLNLKPDAFEAIDLPWNEFGDSYRVHVRGGSVGVSLVVLDGRERATNNPNPRPRISRTVTGPQIVPVSKPESREGLMLVLMNKERISASVGVVVYRIGKRPQQMRSLIKDIVSLPIIALDRFYTLPKLTITVAPCGSANAYSMPDIVVCTELIADLTEKGVPNALHPILLHELAHSLLNLWGLPGYDNEDMADEFAAAFLAKWSQNAMADFIRWFEMQDAVGEAVAQLVNGGRHSLSIQRARNMRRALEQSDVIAARWGRLLVPFAKRQR